MSENPIDPSELTSPGTIHDPALEERRAREAAEREAESRASSETKFDEEAAEIESRAPSRRGGCRRRPAAARGFVERYPAAASGAKNRSARAQNAWREPASSLRTER